MSAVKAYALRGRAATPEQALRLCGPFVMAAWIYFRDAGLTERQVRKLFEAIAGHTEKERRADKGGHQP